VPCSTALAGSAVFRQIVEKFGQFSSGNVKRIVGAGYDTTRLLMGFLMPRSHSDATCQPALLEITGDLTTELQQFSRSVARRLMLDFPVVKRWHETEDICQEAAVRLQKSLLAMEPKSRRHLKNLAALQIRRTLIDMARKFRRTLDQGTLRWTPDGLQDDLHDRLEDRTAPEPDTDSLEQWTQLHSSVDTMPADMKEVFQLIWYLGHSKREVAEIIGTDLRTIQRRWRAAREYLTDRVDHVALLR